jgi:hypothetical protein
MTKQEMIEKYISSIRNASKKAYAKEYYFKLKTGDKTPIPLYRCSTMAAQAVRMRIDAILAGNWRGK